MEQEILVRHTVDVGDAEAPVQEAEHYLTELFHKLDEEGRTEAIVESRIQGPGN